MSEEEGAEGELGAEGAEFLEEAVHQLSAGDVDRLLRGLPSPIATEVVGELIGNKLDPKRLKNLGSLLLGTLRKRPAARLRLVVERLSMGILETFHTELGDRFDDPSVDDLREVLDAVLAEHPPAGVRCTLAWVFAEQMPAAQAARQVLLTDPRLRLPDWPEATEVSTEQGEESHG